MALSDGIWFLEFVGGCIMWMSLFGLLNLIITKLADWLSKPKEQIASK